MYVIAGGCSSLLHLAIQFPILVGALTLAGFATQATSNPGPGDRLGTYGVLTQIQNRLVRSHPELATKAVQLRINFERLDVKPTEDQVRGVLAITDDCTDTNVQDILRDPDLSRKVAWLIYLQAYARDGPVR
jgi:hypothetical protein